METDESLNRKNPILQGGKAHSALTQTSSERPTVLQSWPGLSDICSSTIEQNSSNNLCFHVEMAGDSGRKRIVKDVKTQLEFISLPGDETSHTISLPTDKGENRKLHSNIGIGDEGEASREQRNNLADIAAARSEIEKPVSADEMEKRSKKGTRME